MVEEQWTYQEVLTCCKVYDEMDRAEAELQRRSPKAGN